MERVGNMLLRRTIRMEQRLEGQLEYHTKPSLHHQ